MPPSNKGRQIKIHKAQIPSNMSDKAIALINDALDKFQIEKVIIVLLHYNSTYFNFLIQN